METKAEFYPAAIVGYFNKITSKGLGDEFTFWREKSLFKFGPGKEVIVGNGSMSRSIWIYLWREIFLANKILLATED